MAAYKNTQRHRIVSESDLVAREALLPPAPSYSRSLPWLEVAFDLGLRFLDRQFVFDAEDAGHTTRFDIS